jgi:uncharacterized protein YjbJ (UPF0337 family)
MELTLTDGTNPEPATWQAQQGVLNPEERRRPKMGEKIDDAKGKAKEAVGDATDDQDLKREGKMDRAGASVKEKVGNAVDTVKDKIGDVSHRDNDR